MDFVHDKLRDDGVDHLQQFFTAFPDAHVTILDLIGEGDKIVGRLQIKGTNTGPFAGQPLMGKKVKVHSIRIYPIVDHKIMESWAMQDRLGLIMRRVKSPGGCILP